MTPPSSGADGTLSQRPDARAFFEPAFPTSARPREFPRLYRSRRKTRSESSHRSWAPLVRADADRSAVVAGVTSTDAGGAVVTRARWPFGSCQPHPLPDLVFVTRSSSQPARAPSHPRLDIRTAVTDFVVFNGGNQPTFSRAHSSHQPTGTATPRTPGAAHGGNVDSSASPGSPGQNPTRTAPARHRRRTENPRQGSSRDERHRIIQQTQQARRER